MLLSLPLEFLEPTTGVELRFESRSCKIGRSANERAPLRMGVGDCHQCLCRISPLEPECSRLVEKRTEKVVRILQDRFRIVRPLRGSYDLLAAAPRTRNFKSSTFDRMNFK